MATIVAAAGGGNWTATTTWVGGVVPTAADDVQLVSTSGNVTVNAAAFCRSLDCTGYTGTLTHNTGVLLTIGDAAAGAGNIALKFVATMTYTIGNPATSSILFNTTSPAVQTITTGGKSLGSYILKNATSHYQLTDTNTCLSIVNFNGGTFDTNSQTCNWAAFQSDGSATARTLTLGNSMINITQGGTPGWEHPGATTMTANTATVAFTGGVGVFDVYSKNMNGLSVVFTNSGQILNGATIENFTFTGPAARTATILLSSSLTVTGTLTIHGNSTINRVLLYSNAFGTARAVSATTVSCSNIDFQDIIGTGAATWDLSAITGGSGDCGGNTGITFTPTSPQSWQGTTGGNWSDSSKWTSRVPLPQDDVSIASAFVANQTVTADMPRLGRDISWAGVSGNPSWYSSGSLALSSYGSLTLASTMNYNFFSGYSLAGRGAHTITCAGNTLTTNTTIQGAGSTYTLLDALTCNFTLSFFGGIFNSGSNTITAQSIRVQSVGSVANFEDSILNLTGTTSIQYLLLRTNNGAMTIGAATINIVNPATNVRVIAISGVNASRATINYTISGSTGPLSLGGPFSIGTINFYDASASRALYVQAATIVTVAESFNVYGAAGRPVTLAASSAGGSLATGTAGTLSKPAGVVNGDYLVIQDSNVTGGASWYAGSNSTNVSNNTGWFFQPYNPGQFLTFM